MDREQPAHEVVMSDKQPERPMRGGRQPTNALGCVRSLLVVVAMVGLYCVAGYFILYAIYGFVVGLWHLLVSLSRTLAYGDLAYEPSQQGEAIGELLGSFLIGAVGGLCCVAAKRLSALRDLANKTDDVRAPVLYLRSFHVDKSLARRPFGILRVVSVCTEEEQLVKALREIGPVVAIGKPGERLPRLGAQRIYVEHADWQEQIRSWFARAALVVIQVPSEPTKGVTWEIDQSLSVVALDHLVFLVSRNAKSLDWLNQKLRDHGLTVEHVTNLHRAPYGSPISGVVHFENRQAEFRALVKPPFFNRPFFSPIVPVYRSALQPVTTRITGSWRPLPRAFGGAFIAAVWIAFCVIIIAVGLSLRLTDPWGVRENIMWEQRLLRQLPAEARQFVDNRDKAALGAWMQTHIQNSLLYIPDDVVLAKANVVRRLLAIASPANCAALAEGAITQPTLNELLSKLFEQDPTARTTWLSCHERLLLESLKSQHTETFPVSEADKTAAFALLHEGLSEKDRATYDRITADYEKASAEDHCWLTRAIFQGIERLQEPSRSKLARVALGQDLQK
jgi:hypothetical protein